MKRRKPWWHVVDPTVGPAYPAGFVNRVRPLTTHADLVAAANLRGSLAVQPMVQLVPDVPEPCQVGRCQVCKPDDEDEFWAYRHEWWAAEMTDHGVEFDPTIRF